MTARNFRVHNGLDCGDVSINASSGALSGVSALTLDNTSAPDADAKLANKKYVDDQLTAKTSIVSGSNNVTVSGSSVSLDIGGTDQLIATAGLVRITGNLTVPSGNILTAPTGTFVDSTVTGLLDVEGSANLGDSLTDTVTIAGTIDSNLIPDLSSGSPVRDIGSSTNRWKEGFFERLFVCDESSVNSVLQEIIKIKQLVF